MAGHQEKLTLAPVAWIDAADYFARIRDKHALGVPAMVAEGSAVVYGIFDRRQLRGAVALSVTDHRLEVNALAGDNLGRAILTLAGVFQAIARAVGLSGVRFFTTRAGLVRRFRPLKDAKFTQIERGRFMAEIGV